MDTTSIREFQTDETNFSLLDVSVVFELGDFSIARFTILGSKFFWSVEHIFSFLPMLFTTSMTLHYIFDHIGLMYFAILIDIPWKIKYW